MNVKKIHALSLMGISVAVVGALQLLLHEAMIIIEQARSGGIPYQLSAEILFVVLSHAFIITAIPLLLVTRNKTMASYIALSVLLSIYTQFMIGINVAGVTVSVVILSVLIIYAVRKLSFTIRYFRAK